MKKAICSTSIVLMLIAAIPVSSVATVSSVSVDDEFGTLNPKAPPETAQFQFLVGRWDADYTGKRADGTIVKGRADWRIRFILDGYALQDEWEYMDVDGNVLSHGTMYRTYDTNLGKWTIVEQTTGNLHFNHMTAEKVGDTMVMHEEIETSNGKLKARRVFYNITQDSFDWRVDISPDGGKTWNEGVATMAVKRMK